MIKNIKLNMLTSAVILAFAGFSAPSFAQKVAPKAAPVAASASIAPINETYTLRVSFANQENSPKGKSVIKFKSLVETRSNGRIKVEVYPFSKLLRDQNEFEALELGVTDLIIPTTAKVANDLGIANYQVFDLPFLFTGQEAFAKFLHSDLNKQMLKEVNGKNKLLSAIAFWGNGLRGVSANKPLQTVDDFKGLNIGLQYSDPTIQSFKALGANTSKVNEVDLSKSLVSKVAPNDIGRKNDATDNTMSNYNFYKLYEHQKYFVNTGHAYSVYVVLINDRKLKTFPEDMQKLITQAIDDVQIYHQEIADEDNKKSATDAKEKGTTVLEFSENDKKLLKEKLTPIHESFVRTNKDLMVKVYQSLM